MMRPFRVMTVGTFDNLHDGHRQLLAWCRRLVPVHGELIVGVNSDAFAASYKGRPTIDPYGERVRKVIKTFLPDTVVPNSQEHHSESMLWLLNEWRPRILMVGDDWMGPQYLEQIGVTSEELWELGITLAFKPRGPNPIHSSQMRGSK